MFKAKRRKPVFLSAAVLAILLGSVLIGSTFASGVDYENTHRQPPLGENENYKVALEYHDGSSGYVSMQSAAALTKDTLWCPGRTEVLYIRLTNTEEFPTSCTLTLNVKDSGFGDTLTYAVIEGDLLEKSAEYRPKSWSDFLSKARGGKDEVLSVGAHTLLERAALDPKAGTRHLAIAIHMDENARSDYASQTMNLDFVLHVDANYKPGETPNPNNFQ